VGDEEAGLPQPNYISPPILGGVYHKKYPDRKPMGYPFDRVPLHRFKNLEEYVGMIPNMATTQVKIKLNSVNTPTDDNVNVFVQPNRAGRESGLTLTAEFI